MKRHFGGLGNFLNEMTQTADKGDDAPGAAKITYIDIDDLESNPKNFYGLRDIDELASLIAVSHLVEPLTVSQKSNGKFIIISGHRRCAAVKKLLEEGTFTERKLPCIIKQLVKFSIEQEDGNIIEFNEDAVEILNLIASNRGQRKRRTLEEKLHEIEYLEPFAKALYYQKDSRARGRFRTFFAEEILNISQSQLQRLKAKKNSPDISEATSDDKTSSDSAAQAAFLEKVNGVSPERLKILRQEAEDWFHQKQLEALRKIYEEARHLSATTDDRLESARWSMRASVAHYNIETFAVAARQNAL